MEGQGKDLQPIKNALERLGHVKHIPDLSNSPDEEEYMYSQEWWREMLNVSSLNHTFENFKSVKGTEIALSAFLYLASGKSPWKMLLCYGGVGNGKTHLMEALSIEMSRRGEIARIIPMAAMMRYLKASFAREASLPYEEVFKLYCTSTNLLIDDVGMGGSGSEWEYGQLEELVIYRHQRNMLTVLTTNKDITELPERIISRFRDREKARIVLNEGVDYRPLKEAE